MSLPNQRGAKGGDREADEGRVARVSRLMALAIKFERLIREGEIRNHRHIAEAGQISRARLSQIMRLTDLAPSIQEELLFLPKTIIGPDRFTEKGLRQVARSLDWDSQKKQFEDLKVGGAERLAIPECASDSHTPLVVPDADPATADVRDSAPSNTCASPTRSSPAPSRSARGLGRLVDDNIQYHLLKDWRGDTLPQSEESFASAMQVAH
jgi:hypothetical protein